MHCPRTNTFPAPLYPQSLCMDNFNALCWASFGCAFRGTFVVGCFAQTEQLALFAGHHQDFYQSRYKPYASCHLSPLLMQVTSMPLSLVSTLTLLIIHGTWQVMLPFFSVSCVCFVTRGTCLRVIEYSSETYLLHLRLKVAYKNEGLLLLMVWGLCST